jgi:hypothetical protein
MRGRQIVAGAVAAAVLTACGSSTEVARSTTTSTTAPTTLGRSALVAVRTAAEDLYRACHDGDMGAVHRLVAPDLADLDWGGACAALAAHGSTFTAGPVAGRGAVASMHVTIHTDRGTSDDDWTFQHRHDGWHLIHVPEVLMGGWDGDGHHWMGGPSGSTTPSTMADHHHHGFVPSAGAGSTTVTTMGHAPDDHHQRTTSSPMHEGDDPHMSSAPHGDDRMGGHDG